MLVSILMNYIYIYIIEKPLSTLLSSKVHMNIFAVSLSFSSIDMHTNRITSGISYPFLDNNYVFLQTFMLLIHLESVHIRSTQF